MHLAPGGPQDLIRLGTIVDDPAIQEPNIRSFVQSPPALGRNRVVVIERADRLTPDAANALLKTIEEPNETARFVMTTSASGRILPTVRSRCLMIPCESDDLPPGVAADAAGGNRLVFDRLSSDDLRPLVIALDEFVERVSNASRTESIAVADEFANLTDRYVDLVDEGEERLRRAEFMRIFANLAGRRAGDSEKWQGLLDRSILAHRAILGNVNSAYLVDWMFATT
jgi:DNA polymerase III delta prime subunit